MVVLSSTKDKPIGRITPQVQQVYQVIDQMGDASAKVRQLLIKQLLGLKAPWSNYYSSEVLCL